MNVIDVICLEHAHVLAMHHVHGVRMLEQVLPLLNCLSLNIPFVHHLLVLYFAFGPLIQIGDWHLVLHVHCLCLSQGMWTGVVRPLLL